MTSLLLCIHVAAMTNKTKKNPRTGHRNALKSHIINKRIIDDHFKALLYVDFRGVQWILILEVDVLNSFATDVHAT